MSLGAVCGLRAHDQLRLAAAPPLQTHPTPAHTQTHTNTACLLVSLCPCPSSARPTADRAASTRRARLASLSRRRPSMQSREARPAARVARAARAARPAASTRTSPPAPRRPVSRCAARSPHLGSAVSRGGGGIVCTRGSRARHALQRRGTQFIHRQRILLSMDPVAQALQAVVRGRGLCLARSRVGVTGRTATSAASRPPRGTASPVSL